MCVHMLLVEMLLAVQRKLFVADRTHPPVRLDVPFKAALLEVRWEDDLAQRTAFMDVGSVGKRPKMHCIHVSKLVCGLYLCFIPGVKAEASVALVGFERLMIADNRRLAITSLTERQKAKVKRASFLLD